MNGTYYDGLNSTARGQIVSHSWKVGPVLYDNDCLTDNVNSEGDIRWSGKIGLLTVSEYLRTNSNLDFCRLFSLMNDNYNTCKSTTWVFNNGAWWTMSPRSGNVNDAFNIASDGNFNDNYYINYTYGVRPVLYLSSSVTLSGSGTQSNPYIIN